MDIEQLSEAMFVKNKYDYEMSLESSEVTIKQLSSILYSLFMRGLVILYGDGARVTLNHLSMDQIKRVTDKMRLAKIKTNFQVYDRSTAILLDMLPETVNIPLEIYIMKQNQIDITKTESNDLKDYKYKMYLQGNLYCLHFEIVY
jgi:hypothetical protein